MKIRISDKHTVEYLDGYYLIHENFIYGAESKYAGEEYTCNPQTFAKLTGAVRAFKGVICSQLLTSSFAKAKEASDKDENRKFNNKLKTILAAKERKCGK